MITSEGATKRLGKLWTDKTHNVDKFFLALLTVMGGIMLVAVVSLLMAFPTTWLWNYVMPYLSSGLLPNIDVWHAWALNLLCGLLFKANVSTTKSKN